MTEEQQRSQQQLEEKNSEAARLKAEAGEKQL